MSEYLNAEQSMYLVRECVCVYCVAGLEKPPIIGLLHKSMLVETELGN